MIRTLIYGFLLAATLAPGHSFAQSLPATDLWLASIVNDLPREPVRINESSGYNNQPHFSADASVVYYTREMPAEQGSAQTDIAAYDTGTRATTMVIQTPESEYSPTPIPGRNALSVVRVEPDQKQRLWAIDLADGQMELLLPDAEPVGYHSWISRQEVAMFILGDSFDLYIAKIGVAGSGLAASNIGRSLRTHPASGEVLFVDKNHEPWRIAAYDTDSGLTSSVLPLFPGSEDFTIDKLGRYWTGNDSKLYRRSPGDSRWELVADYSSFGIHSISRLAVDLETNQLAFVSSRAGGN